MGWPGYWMGFVTGALMVSLLCNALLTKILAGVNQALSDCNETLDDNISVLRLLVKDYQL